MEFSNCTWVVELTGVLSLSCERPGLKMTQKQIFLELLKRDEESQQMQHDLHIIPLLSLPKEGLWNMSTNGQMDKETKFLVSVKLMLFLANLPDKCSRACPPPGWITRLSTAASFTDTVFAIRVNSLLTRRLGLGFQLFLLLFFSCFEMLKLFN